jgi:hypothetical protein
MISVLNAGRVKQASLILSICSASVLASYEEAGDPHFKVDQFGYLPSAQKVAVISQSQEGLFSPDDFEVGATLEVVNSYTGEVVFTGTPASWNFGAVDPLNGDKGWWFDFSEVSEPGTYVLRDSENNALSHPFLIHPNLYRNILIQAVRTYYYQREGFAKETPFADARWTDAASHMQDTAALDVFNPEAATARDVTGGWMDAGDQNKYITFLTEPMHQLLTVYQDYPSIWAEDHNIPESGNGIPDLLDELIFELRFMQKMQDSDGGVFIKSGASDWSDTSPPSADTRQRYYGAKCSSAGISLAGIFAHAAYVLQNFSELQSFSDSLTSGARAAWDWVQNNEWSESCDAGEIKSGDADRTLEEQEAELTTAAMWLYALTGEDSFHQHFLDNYQAYEGFNWWGPYRMANGDAVLFYTTLENADVAAAENIITAKRSARSVSDFYGLAFEDMALYRAPMPEWSFHWGHNNARASAGNLNIQMLRYDVDPAAEQDYINRALAYIHWMHGVNPMGKVMLSNMYEFGAENSVDEFYHSWYADNSQWDNVRDEVGPPPGYVVGGPNKDYTGSDALLAGQPAEKMYRDFNGGSQPWEITENGIYYQASYIRLLAHFVGDYDSTVYFPVAVENTPAFSLHDNQLRINRLKTGEKVEIYSLQGERMADLRAENSVVNYSTSGLFPGLYLVKIKGRNFQFIKQ